LSPEQLTATSTAAEYLSQASSLAPEQLTVVAQQLLNIYPIFLLVSTDYF
jgi:hypothetical protein